MSAQRSPVRSALQSRFPANGAHASRTAPDRRRRGLVLDLLLLGGLGLLLSLLGPYRTLDFPPLLRTAYWLIAVLGGGGACITADAVLGPRIPRLGLRIAAVALLMTPPVTLYIYALNALMLDLPRRPWFLPQLGSQVLVVLVLIMAVRGLAWRRVVETRTIVVPPLPEAERALRLRLSARRRSARLIAVEAEDHYVRVHTDAGSELLTMRFSEALEDLAQAYGHRLHRSWWVPAEAIEAVRWKRGGGEARLAGGITAPVSRRWAGALKEAGWR